MKLSFINSAVLIALILILVGYFFPIIHPNFLGGEGAYIEHIYNYWLNNNNLSYPDFFVFFPIIIFSCIILILWKKSFSYSWLFPLGTTLAILSSGFAYLYVLQNGYNLVKLGLGWLIFYVAGNLLAVIGLLDLLKNFKKTKLEIDHSVTERYWNWKIIIKIIFSLLKIALIVSLTIFMLKTCFNKDEAVQDIQREKISNTQMRTAIPMENYGERNKYFLTSHHKVGELHTITYTRVGNQSDVFGKMEINCSKNKIRKTSTEDPFRLVSPDLDLGDWYTPTPDWTDKDIVNFVCNSYQ